MDLNLIRVFLAIYETRSLTAAAARLYVSQPAVSQALARLRTSLEDRLFDRDGRRMRPTPVADAAYPRFHEALRGIDAVVDEVNGFDARVSEREFRIAVSELGEIGWLPDIVAAVRAAAPRVRLETVPLETARLAEWLARGTVDLAISPAELPAAFERTWVKSQGYCVAMGAAHPLADAALTIEEYTRAAHIVVSSDSGATILESAQRAAGIAVDRVVRVRHFATLPLVLASDAGLIATIPESIAAGWASMWPLVLRELPFRMPPVELSLYQRSTTQSTAALRWFRSTVEGAIVGTPGRFATIRADSAVA